MLAQFNLSPEYRQSTTTHVVTFSESNGWEYTPGPKEIDIQIWGGDTKTYVNKYVEYLKEELDNDTVTGNLITLKELESLGCTVPSNYEWGSGGWNCYESSYEWMIANDQGWWTRSANFTYSNTVWYVDAVGDLDDEGYKQNNGVRPVITISKETLKRLNS